MKKNLPVTDQETVFGDDTVIISTTDLKGAITHVNEDFISISGFSERELLGENHNIVRHPDMPPAGFADLWSTLKQGKPWMGIVKNRCKNGNYYWVDAYVSPIYEHDQLIGYQSVRVKPSKERVARADALYKNINRGKMPRLNAWWNTLRGRVTIAMSSLSVVTIGSLPAFLQIDLSMLMGVLAIILTASFFAAYYVTLPMKEAHQVVSRVVDNKLMQYVYTGRLDDIGAIQLAQIMMEAKLRTIVGRLDEVSMQLSAAAEQTVSTAHTTLQGVEKQKIEIEQLASAATQMANRAQEVLVHAESTMNRSRSAVDSSIQGKEIVTQASNVIAKLVDEVEMASKVINQLKSDSEKIGTVVDSIRGIAEQTNLLALNAAIEAARAGDQGRGFAVVADEVRTLATRTGDSTAEIQSMIESLQNSTNKAVSVMANGRVQAETSIAEAARVRDSLEHIASEVDDITDESVNIAHAAQEQNSVANAVHESILEITNVANLTARGAAEGEMAGQSLSQLAGEMRRLVGQFRV